MADHHPPRTTEPTSPTPPPRQGPRPLALHLATQGLALTSWPLGLTGWNSASASWKLRSADCSPATGPAAPRPDPDGLRALLAETQAAGVDPLTLAGAVDAEARRRLAAFLDGVLAYRRHPARRDPGLDPPPVWRQGSTVLRAFADTPRDPGRRARARDGPPVVLVPSLINRAWILNLDPRRAFAPYLAWRGLRPFLLDWGAPGPTERRFTLTDYARRLDDALRYVREATGRPVVLLGYCMGGLLALGQTLAIAPTRQDDLAGIALLATPWDFHADPTTDQGRLARALAPWIDPVLDQSDTLPVDLLQAAFASLDPTDLGRKFRAFAALPPRSIAARQFVALEDWLNDGVALAAAVARETLHGWYGANTPANGAWRVAGRAVLPNTLTRPALVVIPQHDRIVPAASARALADALPGAVTETISPPLGHIGMMTGRRAVALVHDPLARWAFRVARRAG